MSTTNDLIELLHRHFPMAETTVLEEVADELDFRHGFAKSFQQVERRERPIEREEEDLQKALDHLEKAETLLGGLGVKGSEAMIEPAHFLDSIDEDMFELLRPNGAAANKIILHRLTEVKTAVMNTVKKLDSLAASQTEQETRLGAPKKSEAKLLANYLYDVFQRLAGTAPTVSTDRQTNRKYGPFIDLVTATFTHFGISASVESMAVQLCREKKTRKG